nr:TPA_asm: hypothetical protein HUJ06_018710 [Nelumbo nucifera]
MDDESTENGETSADDGPIENGDTDVNDEFTKNGENNSADDRPAENGEATSSVNMQTVVRPAENGETVSSVNLEKLTYLMPRYLDESLLRHFNEKWRLQQIAETEVRAKRFKLIHVHIRLILMAILSSPPEA